MINVAIDMNQLHFSIYFINVYKHTIHSMMNATPVMQLLFCSKKLAV